MNWKLGFLLVLLGVCQLNARRERPARCLEAHPVGTGLCEKLLFGFYYNADTHKCGKWFGGGCEHGAGNSYSSELKCIEDCVNLV